MHILPPKETEEDAYLAKHISYKNNRHNSTQLSDTS